MTSRPDRESGRVTAANHLSCLSCLHGLHPDLDVATRQVRLSMNFLLFHSQALEMS